VDSVEDVIEAARKLEDFVDEVDENEYHSRTS